MEHESGMQFVASKINKLNIENPFISLEWEQVKNKTFTLSFENHFYPFSFSFIETSEIEKGESGFFACPTKHSFNSWSLS